MTTTFENYSIAQWQVGSLPAIAFPVQDINEQGGNRIVAHERTYRAGGKLDDTGSKVKQWSFKALFNNSLEEGAINGVPLYPTVLRQLLASFEEHATGTLTLPTIGDVRARAHTYSRDETPDEVDTARLQLVFLEDNEDEFSSTELKPPTIVATLVRLAEQTVFSQQRNGVWSDDLASLITIASEIQGLMLAPGRAAADVATVVRSHRRALQRLIETARVAGGPFTEPRGSAAERQLVTLLDREAFAEDERMRSRPRTKPFVVDVERTSIFEIAARLNQDATELMDLNSARIDDPFYLDRGTVIRVFESAA